VITITQAVITVTAACRGCGACLLTCPERAIRPAVRPAPGAGPLAVLAAVCTGCGECVEVCPADAIDIHDRNQGAARVASASPHTVPTRPGAVALLPILAGGQDVREG